MIGYLGATLPDGIEAHNVNKKLMLNQSKI